MLLGMNGTAWVTGDKVAGMLMGPCGTRVGMQRSEYCQSLIGTASLIKYVLKHADLMYM